MKNKYGEEIPPTNNVILHEDDCNEEWWQPELHCEKCNCTFMWSSYPDFSEYPSFCPNCGKRFTGIRKGKTLIYSATPIVNN